MYLGLQVTTYTNGLT